MSLKNPVPFPVNLIGIHGLKGSGKDTVARIISNMVRIEESQKCCSVAFATPLKQAAVSLFDLDPQLFYDQSLKEVFIPAVGASPRQIMTKLHDCLVPEFGPDLFVRAARNRWRAWRGRGLFIVTDVRYRREVDWILSEGGVILHVIRAGISQSPASHSSELGLPVGKFPYVIYNDGTLEELAAQVVLLVRLLRGYGNTV